MKTEKTCWCCGNKVTKNGVLIVVTTEHLRNGKIVLYCPECENALPKHLQWRDREMVIQEQEFLREEGRYP